MKNLILLILSPLVAAILFFGLSLLYEKGSTQEYTVSGKIEIILKSTSGQPMDFWDVFNRGVAEAANEFGVSVNSSGPMYEREIQQQIEIMNEAIKKNPPLIMLAANDYLGLVPSVNNAYRRGIPIITFDSAVNSDYPVSFIATDNLVAGEKAGAELMRLMEDHPRTEIAIVSHKKETATAIEREAGVRKAIPENMIIGTWFIEVDPEKAYKVTLELLENPLLGGIVALNEVSTLGVARAIEEKGAQNEVLVVGFDNAIRELLYLEEGIIKATVVQRPYNMGYLAVKTAVEFLNGKNVERFIDTGSVLISRDNIFKREYQELLFPFNESDYFLPENFPLLP